MANLNAQFQSKNTTGHLEAARFWTRVKQHLGSYIDPRGHKTLDIITDN